MHRVGTELEVVINNEANRAVRSQVDNVPFLFKGKISFVCLEKNRCIVICTE